MPFIRYRELRDAVADTNNKNRYGYYEHLEHLGRSGLMVIDTKRTDRPWPLYVSVKVPVFNHEDLQKLTDGVMDLFDGLRGENAEAERVSPSESQPFKDGLILKT